MRARIAVSSRPPNRAASLHMSDDSASETRAERGRNEARERLLKEAERLRALSEQASLDALRSETEALKRKIELEKLKTEKLRREAEVSKSSSTARDVKGEVKEVESILRAASASEDLARSAAEWTGSAGRLGIDLTTGKPDSMDDTESIIRLYEERLGVNLSKEQKARALQNWPSNEMWNSSASTAFFYELLTDEQKLDCEMKVAAILSQWCLDVSSALSQNRYLAEFFTSLSEEQETKVSDFLTKGSIHIDDSAFADEFLKMLDESQKMLVREYWESLTNEEKLDLAELRRGMDWTLRDDTKIQQLVNKTPMEVPTYFSGRREHQLTKVASAAEQESAEENLLVSFVREGSEVSVKVTDAESIRDAWASIIATRGYAPPVESGDSASVASSMANRKRAQDGTGQGALSTLRDRWSTTLGNSEFGDALPKFDDDSCIKMLESVFLTHPSFTPKTLEISFRIDRLTFVGLLDGRVSPSFFLLDLETCLARSGLQNTARVFLMPSPNAAPVAEPAGSEGGSGGVDEAEPSKMEVCVIVIPKDDVPKQDGLSAAIRVSSSLLSLLTTWIYASSVYGFDLSMVDSLAALKDLSVTTAPVWAPLLGSVFAGDLAARALASTRNIQFGYSLFLPSLQIGLFGRTMYFEKCFPRARADVFDFVAASQLTSGLVGFGLFLSGLIMTGNASDSVDTFPLVSSAIFQGSWLSHTLAHAILPAMDFSVEAIHMHPFVVAGYTTLLVNALNMIPIGSIEGGLISLSLFGRENISTVTVISFIAAIACILLNVSEVLFVWIVLIVLTGLTACSFPTQDEITPPSTTRYVLGGLMFSAAAFFLLPVVPLDFVSKLF
ncbi:putative zinc metalloprotease EGY2, chloroplastic [Porphyridium purpureum]|uniref:Putative zinc metalloprotease EGY2, chloroplastic n=1 Tax=Porphyridium purpureum TaxID=35688 RepID=A0A5J4Z4I8_PORPP|nr:putative zinc metalloprotease EGY2, chloroplastic [Porphyridium purpureum]|eukprot:POR9538..scf295_1